MTFVIRYISRSGKKSYLSVKNTLIRKKENNICQFNSIQGSQNYFKNLLSSAKNRKNLLHSHNVNNFYVANFKTDEKVAPLSWPQSKGDRPIKLMPKSIDKLTKMLEELGNNALIMDLEFFKDARRGHRTEQHMAQIAGLILGQAQAQFDYYIFDPDRMDANDQLAYLRKHSTISFAKACKNNSQEAMKKVKAFLEKNNISTIISWGNATDFRVLDDEGFMDMFADMYAIDLEPIFANANGNNAKMSLKGFCNLLNLPDNGTWHVALDDVKMIYRVCQLYMNVLNEDALSNITLNSKKQIDGAASTDTKKSQKAGSHYLTSLSGYPIHDYYEPTFINFVANVFHYNFFTKTFTNRSVLLPLKNFKAKKKQSENRKLRNLSSQAHSKHLQEIFNQPDQFELLKH